MKYEIFICDVFHGGSKGWVLVGHKETNLTIEILPTDDDIDVYKRVCYTSKRHLLASYTDICVTKRFNGSLWDFNDNEDDLRPIFQIRRLING